MSRSPFRMEETDTIRVSYTDLFTCILCVYRIVSTTTLDISRHVTRTGLHTVADLFCTSCDASLGWTYLKAQDRDQVYKEGESNLNLDLLLHFSFQVRFLGLAGYPVMFDIVILSMIRILLLMLIIR